MLQTPGRKVHGNRRRQKAIRHASQALTRHMDHRRRKQAYAEMDILRPSAAAAAARRRCATKKQVWNAAGSVASHGCACGPADLRTCVFAAVVSAVSARLRPRSVHTKIYAPRILERDYQVMKNHYAFFFLGLFVCLFCSVPGHVVGTMQICTTQYPLASVLPWRNG